METQHTPYRQMLSRLNVATGIGTFLYMAGLTYLGILPHISIARPFSPPADVVETKGLVTWAAAFGVIPITCAFGAFVLSRVFEAHNLVSKVLQIRFIWDKYYIVKPLRDRAQSDISLDRATVRKVMNEFYYKAVKAIDPHYVQMFWWYALPFWVIFEQVLVVAISILVLALIRAPHILPLLGYLFSLMIAGALHFHFIAAKKSLDEVREIPAGAVEGYFRTLQPIARVGR
jgi:hypothetical protein